MNTPLDDRSAREARLNEVLGGYLAAGPDADGARRDALLRQHPDLAAELAVYFDDADRLHELAPPRSGGDDPTRVDPHGTTASHDALEAIRWGDSGGIETGTESRIDPTAETRDLPPRGPGGGGGGGGHDPGEPDGPDALPAGERVRYFGDYRLRRVLGQGGMGVVYLADQRSLRRQVALKMIRSGHWADDDEIQRFKNEAQAVAKLDHPGIVTIYEVGEHAGQHFFSMRNVAGGGLDAQLGRFRDDPRGAARLVAEVSRAIHYMHQRAILHRDLKPSNILLDEQGSPHVTDFGLAKRMEGDHDLSQSGAIVGTLQYMSPEQAAGTRRSLTTATDVHGLGTILYALLTGHAPFEGTTMPAILERVRDHMPARPSVENARVDRDIETICLKCLEKDPRQRYDSAAALADDLDRYLKGEPILARRAGAWERVVKWCRRRPTAAALVATAAVAALTLVGLGVALSYQGKLAVAYRNVRDAYARERRTLYSNRVITADREIQENSTHRAEALLDECPESQRNWEWRYLKGLCHTELLSIPAHTGPAHWVAYPPDGKILATAGVDRLIRFWDAESGRALRSITVPGDGFTANALHPDGTHLATVTGSRGQPGPLRFYEVATGRLVREIPVGAGLSCAIAYSPDGRLIAVSSGDLESGGWLQIRDAQSGELVRTLAQGKDEIRDATFNQDGSGLAAIVGKLNAFDSLQSPSEVRIWDVATGQQTHTLTGHTAPVVTVIFSPDGQRLATSSYDATVRIWDAKDGRERLVYRDHGEATGCVIFSPDSRRVASTGDDGSIRIWDAETGLNQLLLRGHKGLPFSLAFRPDGKRLATSGLDGMVKVWDALNSREVLTLNAHDGANGVAFSPDGTRLVTGGYDGLVKLWEFPSGRLLATWKAHDDPVNDVAFSPDGGRIATAAGDWRRSDRPGEVKVWTVATGEVLYSWAAHKGIAWSVAFNREGTRLASSGGEFYSPGQEIILWDLVAGRRERTIGGLDVGVNRVAFSPDDRHLVGGVGKEAQIWSTETGQLVRTLRGHTGRVQSVGYSRDGRYIVSCSTTDELVKVWDAETGAELHTFEGHRYFVYDAVFSPDGRRIVSCGADQTVKLWDIETGQELITLSGRAGHVKGVALSDDGRLIAAACQNGQVKIWGGTMSPGDQP